MFTDDVSSNDNRDLKQLLQNPNLTAAKIIVPHAIVERSSYRTWEV